MEKYLTWVMMGAAVLLLIEIVAGRHKGIYKWHDVPLFFGSLVLGRVVAAPAVTVLIASSYGFFLPHYKNALTGVPFLISFPVILLINEFCFYWVHRWAHTTATARFPILWRIHRTHHSAPYMNVTLYFGRLNLFWYIIIPTAWVMGLVVYLGQINAAITVILLISVWNIITHSHFRWDDTIRRHRVFGRAFRAFEHVIVSPGMHHTHHGFGRDGANYRNFGVFLAVYDWLFGTLYIPTGRPAKYGLPGHEVHWVEELFYPLVRQRTK